jgi:hypothetical protein
MALRVSDLGIGFESTLAYLISVDTAIFVLAIFYFITSFKVLRKLSQSAKLSQRKLNIKRVLFFKI